ELLRKRLKARENEVEQKRVIFLSGLMFVAGFAVAGLDYRFQWLVLPGWLVTAAAVVFVVGYLLFVEVMRENEYLSRTVEVQEDQTVVDSGLYGVIRHPMYAATILMFMAMPLVLGSFFSFLVFLLYPVITVMRIRNEEEVLEKNLKGYAEYKKRVKYRLIPFVW
ncbi:MAG: isoprenylcysteine carboxylmethyltransferase family protein, partial [Firmicutes bacterium]|nr:isoprenylcysteine carboxylmethyltransferase family protein [Bacillota bacterium]